MKREYLKILDIGHSGDSPDRAMIILETAVSQCSFENKTKVIKVITGHGSGKLRNAVRDWCKDQDGRFKDVIYGEDYDCLLYTSPSPRDRSLSRMPSSA